MRPFVSRLVNCLTIGFLGVSRLAVAQQTPPAMQGIGVDEHPGDPLPLERTFIDETGSTMPLGRFFRADSKRPVPVLLVPGYFRCRMLCGVLAPNLYRRLTTVQGWTGGRDYRVLLISIDPREGPHDAAHRRRQTMGDDAGPGWSFLTGSEGSVRALTDALGFRYRYDRATDQFAHAAVIVAITPDGRVARYVYGIDPAPDTLARVLHAARTRRAAVSLQQVLVRCFRFVPSLRRHAALLANVLRGGALAIILGLATVFVVAGRRAVLGARHSS